MLMIFSSIVSNLRTTVSNVCCMVANCIDFKTVFFLFQLSITLEEYVLAGFLALSLLTSLIVVPLSKFRMSRPYGIGLIVLYVIFLVVALLTESNVITADI